MDTNTRPLETHDKSFMQFVTGYDHCGNISIRGQRLMTLLGSSSIAIAIVYSLAIGTYFELHLNLILVSILLGGIVACLIILFNRYFFLFFRKNHRGRTALVLIYLTFNAIISFGAVSRPLVYLHMRNETIDSLGQSFGSPLMNFAALEKATNRLTLEQKQALDSFKLTASGLAFLFSLLPLLVHIQIINKEGEHFGFSRESLREELERTLLEKKAQYARIYSVTPAKPKSDDPFAEEEEGQDNIEQRKEALLKEIQHLEITISQII